MEADAGGKQSRGSDSHPSASFPVSSSLGWVSGAHMNSLHDPGPQFPYLCTQRFGLSELWSFQLPLWEILSVISPVQ